MCSSDLKDNKLAILSNGSPDMLNALVKNSGLARVLDATISVDANRIFKPSPDAYTLIESTLAAGDPRWKDYEMPLVSEDPQLWAIGVRLPDVKAPFGEFIKMSSIDWHRSGKLLDLEKKWGIAQSPYLKEVHAKLKAAE